MRGRSSRSISAFWISSDSCDGLNSGCQRSQRKCLRCPCCTVTCFTAKAGSAIPARRNIATNWSRTLRLTKWLPCRAGKIRLPARSRRALSCECGYSKPCCQVAQPDKGAGPLLAYPEIHVPALVTSRLRASGSTRRRNYIGTLWAILDPALDPAYGLWQLQLGGIQADARTDQPTPVCTVLSKISAAKGHRKPAS